MTSYFFSSQPIINYDGEILAHNISLDSSINEKDVATMSIINTHSTSSINHCKAVINIDEKLLFNQILKSIPSNTFMLSIDDSILKNEKSLDRLSELKELNFKLIIDGINLEYITNTDTHKAYELVDYFKISTINLEQRHLEQIKKSLSQYDAKLIATNVDTNLKFAIAKSIGFDYILGYYYSEPTIIENKKIDAKLLNVVRLYNMLQSRHTTIKELLKGFEANPQLSIELLKYINSGAFSLRVKISSIEHALSLLGRTPLAQWLLMLMYGKQINNSTTQSLLMNMVVKRSTIMKNIAKLISSNGINIDPNEAYLVGVMSLSENIMQAPLNIILKEMHLSDEVTNALINKEGLLAELLYLAIAIEHTDAQVLHDFIDRYALNKNSVINTIATSSLLVGL